MIHVITPENRHLYRQRLEEMYRQRYQIFVSGRGWDLPANDGLDTDQFDGPKTIYFLHFDPGSGDLTGSMRLLPTTSPHLMNSLFSERCEKPIPVGEDVWESSRGCIAPGMRGGEIWAALVAGVFEFCMLAGIQRMSFVADLPAYNVWLSCGARIDPLGLPYESDGETFVPAVIEVSDDTLKFLRKKGNLPRPIITLARDLEHAV